MLGRRLLALLVAVLCIVARLGLEADGSAADEAKALGGPGLVARTSPDVASEPEGSDSPDGLVAPSTVPSGIASIAPGWPWGAIETLSPAHERRGDPKASRGPPSLVVS